VASGFASFGYAVFGLLPAGNRALLVRLPAGFVWPVVSVAFFFLRPVGSGWSGVVCLVGADRDRVGSVGC
jgi:hypothetical protein